MNESACHKLVGPWVSYLCGCENMRADVVDTFPPIYPRNSSSQQSNNNLRWSTLLQGPRTHVHLQTDELKMWNKIDPNSHMFPSSLLETNGNAIWRRNRTLTLGLFHPSDLHGRVPAPQEMPLSIIKRAFLLLLIRLCNTPTLSSMTKKKCWEKLTNSELRTKKWKHKPIHLDNI